MDDDLFSLRGENEEDDDLFAAFSGSDDDPFASLDALTSDADPFASLDTPTDGLSTSYTEEDKEEAAPTSPPAPESTAQPQEISSNDFLKASPVTEDDEPADSTSDPGERPEWLRELSGFDDELQDDLIDDEPTEALPRRTSTLSKMVGSGPKGMAFGMTAQQRMVLSIFLFLDVFVIGFLILLALEVIKIP